MSHDIFFDEQSHTYLVDGQEVPSVTEILAPLHRSYGKINPSVLEYAANRGRAVHEALEVYDLGGELEVTSDLAPYCQAYLDWEQVYKPKWVGVEQIVYCEDGDYIGTLDRIGYFNGGDKLNIVDIKTSQPTREALVSLCAQTHAYAYAYDKTIQIDRWGLFLKNDGTWRFQNCAEYAEKNGFFSWDVWRMLLRTHEMITDVLTTRRKRWAVGD